MAHKAESPAPTEQASAAGKGRATPTRAEQEAARRRPIAPNTKEAKAEARARLAEQRNRARDGMANGEEKYLPARDKGPQKRFVRDYVDAGWHIGELLMPLMLLVIIVTMFMPTNSAVATYAFLAMIVIFIITIGDMIIVGHSVKTKLAARYGADRVERGVRWYAAMRSMQMRFIRLPKPQVKRGEYPTA